MASALAALAPPAKAALVLYSATSDNSGTPNTGMVYRDNPQTDDNDVNAIDLDNVIVPGLTASQSLEVTKVEFQMRRIDGSPATTLSAFYATLTADRNGGADPLFAIPPTFFGSANVSAIASNGTNTPTGQSEIVTIGDGTNILFSLSPSQINRTDPVAAGSSGGEFLVGFKLTDSSLDPRTNASFQGVELAKADTGFFNPVEVYTYDPPSQQSTFSFFASSDPNDGAGLFMRVTGNLLNVTATPEPGSISLAALGGLLLLARRPSRIGN
jgi:hypothetical protein